MDPATATLVLKLVKHVVLPVVVYAIKKNKARRAFNEHFDHDSAFEASTDDSDSLSVRSRRGLHDCEARAVTTMGGLNPSWFIQSLPPHTPLRHSFVIHRNQESTSSMYELDTTTVPIDLGDLLPGLSIHTAHEQKVRDLLAHPAVVLSVKNLFALHSAATSAPLVDACFVEEDGRIEAVSTPVTRTAPEDARSFLAHMLMVIDALTAGMATLPLRTREQRREDEARARLLVTSRTPSSGLSGASLTQVRHTFDGDAYICTGVLPRWLPTLSIVVGSRNANAPIAEPPPRWLASQSSQLGAALTMYKEIQRLLDAPMTKFEIRRHGVSESEISLKRVWQQKGPTGIEQQVMHVDGAMGDLRMLVLALEDLAGRIDWTTSLSPLDEDKSIGSRRSVEPSAKSAPPQRQDVTRRDGPQMSAPAALHQMMVQATARWSGSVEKVGSGVQARLTSPFGIDGLTARLSATPKDSGVSLLITADLPPVAGSSLVLSPESGLAAWMRAWGELEVGNDDLDNAFLVEGDASRIADVTAAKSPLLRFTQRDATVTFEESIVRIELRGLLALEQAPAAIADSIEVWEAVTQRRSGISKDIRCR